MYFIYWFLKSCLLLLILYIGSIYLNDFGLWSVVIGVAVFLAGNRLINSRMEQYLKGYFIKKLPVLAELTQGQNIRVECTNGEIITTSFIRASSDVILIGAAPLIGREGENRLMESKPNRWIKLNQVSVIQKIDS